MSLVCPQCGFTNLARDRACVRCQYPFVAAEPPVDAAGQTDPPPFVSAGFAPRAIARLIDIAAAQMAGPVVGGILLAALGFDRWARLDEFDIDYFPLNWLLGICIVLTYHVVAETFGGTTCGKLLLDLRVVQQDRTPIALWQGVLRNLWFYVDGLLFGLPAYDSMRRSPLRQRIGDKRARTLVLRRRDVPPELRPGIGRMAMGIVAALMFVGVELALLVTLLVPSGPRVPTASRAAGPCTVRATPPPAGAAGARSRA